MHDNLESKEKVKEKYFQDFFQDFFENKLNDLVNSLINKYTQNIEIESFEIKRLENYLHFVNNKYWSIINKVVRPVLLKKNDEKEVRVDIYKILSSIEYTIIQVNPVYLEYKGEKNVEIEKELAKIEDLVNSFIAFECAIQYLANWKSYSKYFSDREKINIILEKKEDTEVRENSMTMIEEHLFIISASKYNSYYPVFTNATWWRLLCFYIVDMSNINK